MSAYCAVNKAEAGAWCIWWMQTQRQLAKNPRPSQPTWLQIHW